MRLPRLWFPVALAALALSSCKTGTGSTVKDDDGAAAGAGGGSVDDLLSQLDTDTGAVEQSQGLPVGGAATTASTAQAQGVQDPKQQLLDLAAKLQAMTDGQVLADQAHAKSMIVELQALAQLVSGGLTADQTTQMQKLVTRVRGILLTGGGGSGGGGNGGSGGALTPPPGTKASGSAWLPPCSQGQGFACADYINGTDKGCAATDGTHVYKSMGGGNNCFDALSVRQQICNANLDVASFQSACFVVGTETAPLPPAPAGTTAHVVNIPGCAGGAGACAAVVLLGQMGCTATNGTKTFKTPPGNNNACDTMTLRSQICNAGMDPTQFSAACYTKP